MKQKYYVQGMHCAACENLIEHTLKKQDKVNHVRANLAENTVDIDYTSSTELPLDKLNALLGQHGYTFSKSPVRAKATISDYINSFMLALGIIVLYLIAEKSGVFNKSSLSESSTTLGFFLFGVAASLSSCAALVGGLLLSLSSQWKSLNKSPILPFAMFNLGRLVSFALLGGLLGLIGNVLRPSFLFTSLMTIAILVLMILIALQMLGVKQLQKIKFGAPKFLTKYASNEENFTGKYMPFVAGALTFIIPCGFTFIAQTNALATQSFAQAMIYMTAFALGTLPMLSIISIAGMSGAKSSRYSVIFNLVSGFLILFFALYSLNSQLNLYGLPSLSDIVKSTPQVKATSKTNSYPSGEIQVLKMTAKGFEYFPKEVYLKVGVPVRWEFDNEGVYGCAQSVYARGLYPEVITLEPGENIFQFTPKTRGTYKISCSMGMVPPVIVHVE